MTLLPPSILAAVDFVQAEFLLEFQEPLDFSLERMLRLRRDLRAAAQIALADEVGYAVLFEPALSSDPVAVRRHQKPGPSFIFKPQPSQCGYFDSGDTLRLDLVFWGQGAQHLADFARVLAALGQSGLHRGEGRFELLEICALNPEGVRQTLWTGGRLSQPLTPPVLSAAWWLDAQVFPASRFRLEFVTPARLLSQGRPLFRPTFARLLPFVLRRISSMVHAHCGGLELFEDLTAVLETAGRIASCAEHFFWKDWRTLACDGGDLDLGGVSGHAVLDGEELDELARVLALGALLNLGKNAAYGAGSYRITW